MALGRQLREARLSRNLTASQVAAATRMTTQMVEAIEIEDFKRMAAPIYAKGFIRLYAEYVGLDPRPLIQEYLASFANAPAPSLITESKPARDEQAVADAAVAHHQREYGVCDEFVVHPRDEASAESPAKNEPDLFSRVQPAASGGPVRKTFEREAPEAGQTVEAQPGKTGMDGAAQIPENVRRTAERLVAWVRVALPRMRLDRNVWRSVAVAVLVAVVVILLCAGVNRWLRGKRARVPAPAPRAQRAEPLRLAVPVPDPYVN